MMLKWPLIAGLILALVVRSWAKRSTPVRYGLLAVGWLGVIAQAASAAHYTFGDPAEPQPTSALLNAWFILIFLAAVVAWLQRDTRPNPPDRQPDPPHPRDHRETRRTGSTARNAGRALRNLLGEDRDAKPTPSGSSTGSRRSDRAGYRR